MTKEEEGMTEGEKEKTLLAGERGGNTKRGMMEEKGEEKTPLVGERENNTKRRKR